MGKRLRVVDLQSQARSKVPIDSSCPVMLSSAENGLVIKIGHAVASNKFQCTSSALRDNVEHVTLSVTPRFTGKDPACEHIVTVDVVSLTTGIKGGSRPQILSLQGKGAVDPQAFQSGAL